MVRGRPLDQDAQQSERGAPQSKRILGATGPLAEGKNAGEGIGATARHLLRRNQLWLLRPSGVIDRDARRLDGGIQPAGEPCSPQSWYQRRPPEASRVSAAAAWMK